MNLPIISTRYDHVNQFVNGIAPIVCNEWLRRRANGEKTISPAVVIAQGGKESGWDLNASTVFGIKGSGVELNTSEFINGEYVNIKDSFAAYKDLAGSVQGYFDLMQWENYDDATSANTVEGELEGLTNDVGYAYATAPDYYETTLAIINDFGLRVFNDYVWSCVNREDADTTEESHEEVVENETDTQTYTVQSGDTLSGIAAQFGTTYQRLADINEIEDPNMIYPGQIIIIDGEAAAPAEDHSDQDQRTYTVVSGDSLWKIADEQLGDGTRYTEIKELNGLESDTIYPGDVLNLPE